MNFREWVRLSSEKQVKTCQFLDPYKDWGLFKTIEKKFLLQYGTQPGIKRVFCGMGSGLGPYNAITVFIKRGQRKARLPTTFMGFLIEKVYESGRRKVQF